MLNGMSVCVYMCERGNDCERIYIKTSKLWNSFNVSVHSLEIKLT
jgi:hypothetical protein